MTPPAQLPEPTIRLPMWKLSACLLAAPKVVLFVALGVAISIGGDLWDDRLKAEFWAGIVLYAGTVCGLALLWASGPRTAAAWRPLIRAGWITRLVVTTSAAAGLAVVLHPEPAFYWIVIILASAGIFSAERLVLRSALARPIALSTQRHTDKPESRAA